MELPRGDPLGHALQRLSLPFAVRCRGGCADQVSPEFPTSSVVYLGEYDSVRASRMMIEIDERVDLSRLVPTTIRHDCAHQLRRPTTS